VSAVDWQQRTGREGVRLAAEDSDGTTKLAAENRGGEETATGSRGQRRMGD